MNMFGSRRCKQRVILFGGIAVVFGIFLYLKWPHLKWYLWMRRELSDSRLNLIPRQLTNMTEPDQFWDIVDLEVIRLRLPLSSFEKGSVRTIPDMPFITVVMKFHEFDFSIINLLSTEHMDRMLESLPQDARARMEQVPSHWRLYREAALANSADFSFFLGRQKAADLLSWILLKQIAYEHASEIVLFETENAKGHFQVLGNRSSVMAGVYSLDDARELNISFLSKSVGDRAVIEGILSSIEFKKWETKTVEDMGRLLQERIDSFKQVHEE